MIFKEFQILALPVLQINVVKAEGNNTAVKFSIESGDELQQCWLEHSIDGRNYSRIKLINYESISQLRYYLYTIETPLNQCNFYRLNGTSISGRELYSNVVSLCREMNTLISVYPNPVINDYVNVRMQGMEKGFYEISISNILGQVLYYKGINIKHFNELLGINTKPFLKQGTFILTIRNDKGIVQSFKLVVF